MSRTSRSNSSTRSQTDGLPLRIRSLPTSEPLMPASEPSSLGHLLLLLFCATLAFVILALSLIYWNWLVLGASFTIWSYYMSEVIREVAYLIQVRKENNDVE